MLMLLLNALCRMRKAARSLLQSLLKSIVHDSARLSPFQRVVSDPDAVRKRPVGFVRQWQTHRQHQAARLAAAGYQLKCGALEPLLLVESEPGLAIRWALQVMRPSTVHPDLSARALSNMRRIL